MPGPCPCGSGIKPGQAEMAYITQDILDGAASTAVVNIVTLLDPLYGRAVNLTKLCAEPAPKPPTSIADWYENPIGFLDDILASVLSISWNLWCECIPCPPIAGCTGTNTWTVDTGDAFCPPSATVVPPDPCSPCQSYEYVKHDSATYYVRNSAGTCYGPFTGLDVRWTCPSFDPPDGRVIVESYGGTGIAWNRATFGDSVQIFQGDGDSGSPVWIWIDDGTTVDTPPGPLACDDTTICTAVDYIRDRVSVLERLIVAVCQQLDIVNQETEIQLPGGGPPLTGPLAEVIAPALRYLLPIVPVQLTNADVTTITASTLLDVTNLAYVNIVPTVIPDYMGYRGSGDTTIYFTNARNRGPAEVLMYGQDGILFVGEILYPTGLELIIPSTATGLAINVEAGVTIEVTTYQRHV